MNPITSIPTRTADSLGTIKSDEEAIPEDKEGVSLPAAQYNVAADGVRDAMAAIGLGDGTTVGSLEYRAQRASGEGATGAVIVPADFTMHPLFGLKHYPLPDGGGTFLYNLHDADPGDGPFAFYLPQGLTERVTYTFRQNGIEAVSPALVANGGIMILSNVQGESEEDFHIDPIEGAPLLYYVYIGTARTQDVAIATIQWDPDAGTWRVLQNGGLLSFERELPEELTPSNFTTNVGGEYNPPPPDTSPGADYAPWNHAHYINALPLISRIVPGSDVTIGAADSTFYEIPGFGSADFTLGEVPHDLLVNWRCQIDAWTGTIGVPVAASTLIYGQAYLVLERDTGGPDVELITESSVYPFWTSNGDANEPKLAFSGSFVLSATYLSPGDTCRFRVKWAQYMPTSLTDAGLRFSLNGFYFQARGIY